ncbi:MAG: hypothetical protein ACHQRM_06185 [Bacteroidia bacterium]
MISKEVFFKVNDIRLSSTKYGVPHKRENDGVPLKVFLKCADCSEPLTGYIVKKKNLYYYKCRKVGCKCNKSAKDMHKLFLEELSKYQVKETLMDAIRWKLESDYTETNQDNSGKEIMCLKRLEELDKGTLGLQEKFHVKEEMTREVFDRLMTKLVGDRDQISKELSKLGVMISNLSDKLKQATTFCLNLPSLWAQSGLNLREKLQKLIFPEGLFYDKNLQAFRTTKINSVIAEIARVSRSLGEDIKGLPPFLWGQSLFAEREGFEPPAPLLLSFSF